MIRRCADLADLLASASAGLGDLAIVSSDLRDLDRDAVAHLVRAGLAVIGAASDADEASERRLKQLGMVSVLHPGSDDSELVAALEARSRTGPRDPTESVPPPPGIAPAVAGRQVPDEPVAGPDEEPVRGDLVAVWGPTGAPGRPAWSPEADSACVS